MVKIKINGPIIENDYEWIYNWLEMDCACAKKVEEALQNANGEDIEVHINSPGGLLTAGGEIYGLLKEYSGKVKIIVMGEACSAASLILCAGESEIHLGSFVMIHNVQGGAAGDHNVMDKMSEVLKTANKTVAEVYMEKTGKSLEEVLAVMEKETYLSAQDAVDFGICNKIATGQNAQYKLTASRSSAMLSDETIAKVKALFPKMDNDIAKETAFAKLNLLNKKER